MPLSFTFKNLNDFLPRFVLNKIVACGDDLLCHFHYLLTENHLFVFLDCILGCVCF